MLFRILGPLEVHTREGWRGIGAPKWRALLGALLLRPGQVVPAERLASELWGDRPPPAARKLISGYVFHLRRMIGDPDARVLVTQAPGYRLLAARPDLDACQFEDLLVAGRAALARAEPAQAAGHLAQALALWRGPALADVPPGPLVSAESGRLEELRLTALEMRIEADLACGRDTSVVGELRRLTAEHPLRERLWAALLRALHSSGRSAEALEVYAQARQVIADELGAGNPGPTEPCGCQLAGTACGRGPSQGRHLRCRPPGKSAQQVTPSCYDHRPVRICPVMGQPCHVMT